MKNFISIILTLLIAVSAPVESDAQGLLKKINKKLEQTNSQLKGLGLKSSQKSASGPSSTQSGNSDVNTGGTQSSGSGDDLYPDLKNGCIIRDIRENPYVETASTKFINVKENVMLSDFHDGMALVREGSNDYYFISIDGEKCPFKGKIRNGTILGRIDDWPRFDNGRALIYTGKEWVIIDKKANIIKTLDINGASNFCDGIAQVTMLAENGAKRKYGYIDLNGNPIFPMLSYTVEKRLDGRVNLGLMGQIRKSEGQMAVCRIDPSTGYIKWGFANEKGVYTITPKYSRVKNFHDGLAAVQEVVDDESFDSGRWGFINTKGEVVIDFIFSREPSDFDNGYALVQTKDGEDVVIDKSGNIFMQPERGWSISDFINGHAVLSGSEEKGDGFSRRIQYGVTDGGRKKVSYEVGEFIGTIYIMNERAYYEDRYSFAWIDIPTMTTKATFLTRPFSEGIAAVPDGYVNEKGEYVIRFKESAF